MDIPGFYREYRNKKETGIGGILFQCPMSGIIAIKAVFLLIGLLLLNYFIVSSKNENHVLI